MKPSTSVAPRRPIGRPRAPAGDFHKVVKDLWEGVARAGYGNASDYEAAALAALADGKPQAAQALAGLAQFAVQREILRELEMMGMDK
jgi:hypothetical protein